MKIKIGVVVLVALIFLLSGCDNSFKGGFFAMDIPQTVDHDTWMNRVGRIDNQMIFSKGKVIMKSFFGKSLTCDYEVKDSTIYVNMPDGTRKEYYIIDNHTICEDKLHKEILWKTK